MRAETELSARKDRTTPEKQQNEVVCAWAPTGMAGGGALAPPWEMLKSFLLQMLSNLSRLSIYALFLENVVSFLGFAPRPSGELSQDPAGGLPSFRPPHCPLLEKSCGCPCVCVFETTDMSKIRSTQHRCCKTCQRQKFISLAVTETVKKRACGSMAFLCAGVCVWGCTEHV